MEVFDKDGNPVEGVMTADEVAAKIAAEKAEWEKTAPPAPAAPAAPVVPKADDNEPPAWFKPYAEKVDQLSGNQRTTLVQDVVRGLDADKRAAFDSKFNSLTNYPETPEGIQQRARDAYLLTTGQPYNTPTVNMANIVNSTSGPVRPSAPAPEVDKAFAETFGLSPDDIKKYGPTS